ncbi:expressed unknown protein [Seminavis robusta]|uniref:Voltage-gated hydrogen channel 1 n=1 Tax=Seminavis robusta TaxID=568900 RepID=A0A9N8DR92_9STRA|nr:expressed unknown protein [Seminavis robusta]|eukprot:Sro282_g107460.1 n/a (382) ;mRNA; r:30894-32157
MSLPKLPEDESVTLPPPTIRSSVNEIPRRPRPRRTKQWSDGVIGMAHNPREKEIQELMEFKPRALRRQSDTESVIALTIPTHHDVEAHVEEEHGADSWRYKVMGFLHQKKVQYALMGLLLLDVIILFIEVTLLAMYPTCDIIRRDGISCCSDTIYNGTDDHNHMRFLAAGGGGYQDVCQEANEGSYLQLIPEPNISIGCDSHKWHAVRAIEKGLFICTMTILSVFFLELNLLMVVLRPSVFFRQLFYLLDYIIIGVSLAFELFFFTLHDYLSSSLVGALVVFRSWRYVRISHGIVGVTHELAEQKLERLLNYTEHLEDILREQGTELPEGYFKVEKLRQHKDEGLAAEIRRHHAHEKRQKSQQTLQSGEEDDDPVTASSDD